jgi:hypothetical protein
VTHNGEAATDMKGHFVQPYDKTIFKNIRREEDLNVPLSYCVKGIKESTAKPVGMPMTTPEKVAFPPKYFAYSFADETMMKNDTYVGQSRPCE